MDTGRAGAIGSVSIDRLLGKSWFAAHGLLPRGYRKEGLHSWPARDFELPAATGTLSDDKSLLTYADTAGDEGCFGWNFGSNLSKALIIVGNTQTRRNRTLLALSDGEPNDHDLRGAKSLVFVNERFGGSYYAGSTISANGFFYGIGVTLIGALDAANFKPHPSAPMPSAMALYYDSVGDMLRVFLRYGMSAWIHASASSSHLAQVRCASILSHVETSFQAFSGPMGIYAE